MALIYILEFLFFAFVGWLLDSAYRSFYNKKLTNAGYFKGPICPIYGFGGLTLVFLFKYLSFLRPIILLLIASFSLVLVEYLGGIYCEKILKLRLWDYSKTTFNLGGHIDLLHSFYWLIIVVLFYFFIFPYLLFFEKLIYYPEYFKMPALFLFVILAVWLTVRKNPDQFLEIKTRVMNLSVSDYQVIFSNFKKLSRTHSTRLKELLTTRLQAQLKNTGARLRNINPLKIKNLKIKNLKMIKMRRRLAP